MATIENFEDMEIWQKARLICQAAFEIRVKTNLKTDYRIYDQINSSSGSIMDNIAEGFERNGNKGVQSISFNCESILWRNEISII